MTVRSKGSTTWVLKHLVAKRGGPTDIGIARAVAAAPAEALPALKMHAGPFELMGMSAAHYTSCAQA